jgi:hypothetical protein
MWTPRRRLALTGIVIPQKKFTASGLLGRVRDVLDGDVVTAA